MADGVSCFVATVIVWTAGEMLGGPVHLRARYMGVFTVSFSGANMVGAPLGGMVLARCGGAYVWACALALALAPALLYRSIHGRIGSPPPAAQER